VWFALVGVGKLKGVESAVAVAVIEVAVPFSKPLFGLNVIVIISS
jgi:hypothetical protein